jgi:PBP1b-binding outer membrane lipoprotein LpoB
MRTLILTTAALLLLAGCNNNPAPSNVAAVDANQTNVAEPDVTEVPDESADANGAAADIDDGNKVDGNGSDGATGASNASR